MIQAATQGAEAATQGAKAAKFVGRENELGTVEHGKIADLILLDANPLENISNTRKILAVIRNGQYLNRAVLDALLAKAKSAAAVPAEQ